MSEISVVVVGSTSINSVVGNGDSVQINVADQTVGGGNGAAATIQAGTVTTIDATQTATVTNVGTAYAAKFNFSLPRGYTGAAGPANSLSIGSVSTGTTAAVSITGSAPSQSLSFVLPLGPTGPANSLSIGSVSTGATATVSISGTAPSQKLSFVLQPGPAGPANSLSIGSVSTGTTAAVTISGSSPSQTLSFVLPQGPAGQAGQAGPSNSLSIGSVTTGATAAVSISGSAPSQTLSFVLPQGPAGTPNSLSIGSVTTGTTAAVSISGSAPSQTLSFVLPQGPQGIQGPQGPVGTANLADETPQPLGTASAGTALTAARADHVHDVGSIQYSSLAGIPSTFTPSPHLHSVSDVTGLQAALDGKQAAGTYATLVGGTVPSSQLPSYVDDVIEYANLASFTEQSTGKIYVARDTGKIYRWSGSAYIEISPSPGSTDSVTEGSTNLYFTNARASAAAPVQSVAGRTGTVTLTRTDVGLGNVDNTSDANKPVSTAQAAADAAVQAFAIKRSNHTGTQTASTISDFATEAAKYGPVVSVVGRTGTVTLSTSDITGLQTALDAKQAAGNYVTSVNSLYGNVKLAAGTNIAITASGQTITIASTGIGANDVVDGGVYSGRLILSNTVSFTTQPADTTAAFRAATFTSEATTSAGGLSLRYQWQRSDDGGTTWADIYGARSKTLTVSQLTYAADNNDRYRVVASSVAAQSVASSAAKLTFLSSNWGQLGKTLGGTATGHLFGQSVRVGGQGSGTVLAISAPGPPDSYGGAVRAYQWNGSGWSQRGSTFQGTTFTSNGDTVSNQVGSAIALGRDGASLAIATSSPLYNPTSTTPFVHVYNWDGSSWAQVGSSGIPFFPRALAIGNSGTVVACGYSKFSSEGLTWRGQARVYTYSGSAWVQKGQDLLGTYGFDGFGASLSLSADGNTLAVGAHTSFWGDGYVSVYRWIVNAWSLVGRVGRPASTPTDSNAAPNSVDYSGRAISLSADGSVLAVGIPGYRTTSAMSPSGIVRFYTVDSNSVTQRGGDLVPASSNSQTTQGNFGYTVNISDDGNSLATSDFFTSGSDSRYKSRIRTYLWAGAAWTQYGDPIVGEFSDACGDYSITLSSVGMSSDGVVVACGAECGTNDVTDSGVVRVYGFEG